MFHVCLCYAVVPVSYSLVITCCEKADHMAAMCTVFSSVLSLYQICPDKGVIGIVKHV